MKHFCHLTEFRLSSLSVKKSVKAVAGDYIRVTHPHCVSVVKLVTAKTKVEREEIKPEKDLKRKEQIVKLI